MQIISREYVLILNLQKPPEVGTRWEIMIGSTKTRMWAKLDNKLRYYYEPCNSGAYKELTAGYVYDIICAIEEK
jgi:ppGpp synthetase/RelA/SpoT-type nucleotidyltranferase